MNTKIKICGLINENDIGYINKYLPDYVGFVFAKSKRQVSASQVANITRKLSKYVLKVGVFVNESIDNIRSITEKCNLNIVQVHGDEDSFYFDKLRLILNDEIEIWKAVRVKNKESIELLKDFKADAYVLDAFSEDSYGGSGKVFDWELAIEAKKFGKTIIAGGLDKNNVGFAIDKVSPFAVDVSSSVELDGGYGKDENKIKEFIDFVRTMEGKKNDK